MNTMMKKTIAAVLALSLIGGGLPTVTGGVNVSKPSITAYAADGDVACKAPDTEMPRAEYTFDEATGVLTIGCGWVRMNDTELSSYRNNPNVKKIQFAPRTSVNTDLPTTDNSKKSYAYVLSQDMNSLFKDFKYVESIDMTNAYFVNAYYGYGTWHYWNKNRHYADAHSLFEGCTKLKNVTFSNYTPLFLNDAHSMFKDCESLNSIKIYNNMNISVQIADDMFKNCNSLVNLDLTGLDFNNYSNNSSTQRMFKDLTNLKTVKFAFERYGDIVNMSEMFSGCTSLELADIRCFGIPYTTTYKLKNTSKMFYNCSSLETVKPVHFNGSSLDDKNSYTSGLIINKTFFYAPSLTDASSMFEGCSSLMSFYLSEFNETDNTLSSPKIFLQCSRDAVRLKVLIYHVLIHFSLQILLNCSLIVQA